MKGSFKMKDPLSHSIFSLITSIRPSKDFLKSRKSLDLLIFKQYDIIPFLTTQISINLWQIDHSKIIPNKIGELSTLVGTKFSNKFIDSNLVQITLIQVVFQNN